MLPNSIVFVTSANLATNPRLVKEVQLAVKNGLTVNVMACAIDGWSKQNELLLQRSLLGAEIKYVKVTRSDFFPWFLSLIIEKVCLLWYTFSKCQNITVMAYAEGKRNFLLIRALNKTDWNPSLVIAHNPSAFYPAYTFAKKRKTLFAIDVEDYHPGENQTSIKQELVKQIMQYVLPKTDYLSYASPLILEKTTQEIENINHEQSLVINNVFLRPEFDIPKPTDDKNLKLVWFSQNIDYKRGLEKIFDALDNIDIPFTLTLIGNARESFINNEVSHRKYITLLNPLPQSELHKQLSNYNIGLAVEDELTDVNRTICLTNKIWAYFQAGLYIIATDTAAQRRFLSEFSKHGILVKDDVNSYVSIFKTVSDRWELLNKLNLERFHFAMEFCWEVESEKLLKIWNEVMKPHAGSNILHSR